jgi:NADH:ubiquinone oxidoreductase subunit 5 (subunit L)/multisubunit Na+/H+ antiporter MnhA subunit
MEGPTPVSALLHSATMVTAGVYLVIRCSYIFHCSLFGSFALLLVGSITAVFAGVVACFQWDIKKIIAYSTCSQLGLMFIACGSFNYKAALYHLVTHAYSKALLFLIAGLVIHFFSGEQDIRKMGSCANLLPYHYILFLFSNLSLIGFPFTSGFYSKELIINGLLIGNAWFSSSFLCLLFLFSSTALTCLYSFRLIYHVFWKPYSGTYTIVSKANLSFPHYLNCALLLLFVLSFTVGLLFRPYFMHEILFLSKSSAFSYS